MTAAERADMLTARLAHLANQAAATAPDAVQVAATPTGDASLTLAGTTLISVTPLDAKAANYAQPLLLAQSWAKNLRAVLTPPSPASPAPTLPAPAANAPATDGLLLVTPPAASTAPASPVAPGAPTTPTGG